MSSLDLISPLIRVQCEELIAFLEPLVGMQDDILDHIKSFRSLLDDDIINRDQNLLYVHLFVTRFEMVRKKIEYCATVFSMIEDDERCSTDMTAPYAAEARDWIQSFTKHEFKLLKSFCAAHQIRVPLDYI